YYRERLQPVVQAEEKGVPIYVIKSSSDSQIEQFLADLFMVSAPHHSSSPYIEAIEQADEAVQMVLAGEKYVDLRPAPADVRREQHQLAQKASLVSQSFGTEPHRFVRIFRD
ncbi:MAG TPA: R3H domain-containing nucleic acid-binding protein, partial [Anaerolineaceae bacterium]|nr:R3H domain-containing nucleic acid-binding protein [Anaerolineaceae bacterium]HOG77779.1 R3H domain-containing nucleic acid-binding protein [Anaerolineaceae bacterium]